MSVHASRRLIPANLAPPKAHASTLRLAVLACVAVGGVVTSAHGIVANGSFEQPTVPVSLFATFSGGSTAITGWTVVGDRVSVISTSYVESGIAFNSQSGAQWLDLTGPSSNQASNGVSQDVATTLGQLYRVSFYVGSATNNAGIFASTVDLSIDGGARLSFTNPTAPRTFMDWQLFSVDFTATSASTNLTFFNGSASNNGLSGLDNVTLEVIPAPGAAALLGLGGLVLTRRRR